MTLARVLVVEDDAPIRRGVVDALKLHGYAPDEAADGVAGLKAALIEEVDLVLLDLALPKLDGFAVLAELRKARPALPVIVLTARGAEEDRVRGLRTGADDYVVKPFGVRELIARIEAVIRRTPSRAKTPGALSYPGVEIDFERREARFADGGRAELTEREAGILRYLAANGGRAIGRDELLQRVWGLDPRGLTTRTVDMHLARLREKLRDDAVDPRIVLTVRGRGYMLGAPESTT